MNWLQRTELLIGNEALERLAQARVLVVGLGGIGSYAAEYLGRAGIGHLTIVDGDVVEMTNRNRQLPALVSTEGYSKASYMAARLHDINPTAEIVVKQTYIVEEVVQDILSVPFDYVLDAIDTIAPKVSLIKNCLQRGYPLVSAMGAGGKIDPALVRIDDIWHTRHCTLAQQVRKTLRKWKVEGNFACVYSLEIPNKQHLAMVEGARHKKSYLGTISYMPSLFGAWAASVVIRSLIQAPYP